MKKWEAIAFQEFSQWFILELIIKETGCLLI